MNVSTARPLRGALFTVVLLMAAPGSLVAQACLGLPAPAGLVGLAAGVQVAEGVRRYGGELAANTPGRIAVAGSFYVVEPRAAVRSSHMVRASVAYKLAAGGFSICPVAQASTAAGRVRQGLGLREGSRSDAAFGLGLGLSRRLVAGRTFEVSAHAVPMVLLERLELRGDGLPVGGGEGERVRNADGSMALAGRVGLGLRVGGFLAGGDVLLRTGSRASGVVSLAVGFIL